MDFNSYQEKAKSTAVFPNLAVVDSGFNGGVVEYIYPALGLVGEAGEVAEKIKKLIRDKGGVTSEEDIQTIRKELGDVLWYVAVLSDSFGLTLQEVAQGNLDKLASRKDRNVLKGSGDDR